MDHPKEHGTPLLAMSSLKMSENEPYIISLDSFDLKYLHTNINSNMAGVTPIWNCAQKNYYEFLVVTDVSESDEETDVNGDMECQICNLCNIEVPVIFLDEHYKSVTHTLFQELTKTALERAAKSMDTCVNISKQNINSDIYYCSSCSVAVSTKYQLIHEESNQHLTSHKYNENMKSLIKLYINIDSASINAKNHNKENIMNNDNEKMIKKNDTKLFFENDSKKIMISCNEKMTLKNNNEVMMMKNASAENILKYDNDNKEMILKNVSDTVGTSKTSGYDQELTKFVRNTGHSTPYNDHDFIKLLPKFSYHGLKTYYGNKIFCVLCLCTIEQGINIHINSYKHRLQIEKPPDNYGIREIDSRCCHCVVCNLIIGTNDSEEHVNEDNYHKKLLERFIRTKDVTEQTKSTIQTQATYKTNHIINTSNPKCFKCELCNVKIPNTDKNVIEHVQAKRHTENLLKSKTFRHYCLKCNVGFDDLIIHTFNKYKLC